MVCSEFVFEAQESVISKCVSLGLYLPVVTGRSRTEPGLAPPPASHEAAADPDPVIGEPVQPVASQTRQSNNAEPFAVKRE